MHTRGTIHIKEDVEHPSS